MSAVLYLAGFLLWAPLCWAGHAEGPFQGPQEVLSNTSWEDQVNKSKVNIDAVANEIFPYVVEGSSDLDVSVDCMTALLKTFKAFRDLKGWAVRLMDSSGKLPEGLLEGRLASIGSYDECLDLVAVYKAKKLYHGKYCTVYLSSGHDVQEMFTNETDAAAHLTTLLLHPERMTRLVYRVAPESRKFRMGICVPSVCSLSDVQNVVSHASAKSLGAKTQVERCEVKKGTKILGFQGFLIFCACLLLCLILSATALDMRAENDAQKSSEQGGARLWLSAFSLSRNLRTLTHPEEPDLAAAQGVKALSMAWLICGHTYFLTENTHMFSGLLRAYDDMAGDLLFSPFINYTLAASSFFLVSGFFLAYRSGSHFPGGDTFKSCCKFMVRRYFRMTAPFLAAVSMLLVLPLVSGGPFWEDYAGAEIRKCSSVWWTNLFYISNFWRADQMCLFVTWYTSNVFQFTLLALLILLLFQRDFKLGIVGVGVLLLAGSVVTGLVTFVKDLPPGVLFEPNYREAERVSTWVYHKPYAHIGAFCVGILLGRLLRDFNKTRLSTLAQALGWVAFLTTTSVVFQCGYAWNLEKAGTTAAAFYAALHRTLWALAVAWLLYACATKHAGILNDWLSWSPLQAVGRLSYTMLLLHPLVIISQKSQNRHITFFSHYGMMQLFLAHYAITLVLSFAVYLCVDRPFAELGKTISEREFERPSKLKAYSRNVSSLVSAITKRKQHVNGTVVGDQDSNVNAEQKTGGMAPENAEPTV